LILACLLTAQMSWAQQIAKSRSGTFALMNASLETVANGRQEGNLLIQDGKIAAMGPEISIPEGAERIDCSGLTIYPGMIDGGTTLGLGEVGSVSLTQDADEIGEVTPQMEALTAVNPNSVMIPVTRVNGVTTVLTQPKSGLFPGTAALIHLHGYTPKQMYAGFKGVVLNFPTARRRGWRDRRSDEDREKDLKKALKDLSEVWEKARLYARIDSLHQAGQGEAPAYNPEMARLAEAATGKLPVLVEVNRAQDIEGAIKWVEAEKVNAIFTGVAEGWRVADKLAAANIPVITGPVLSTPNRDSDRYDRPYANAGLMAKAGVKVAIRTNETENVRNLPFHAGFAAAYGLGREAALRAVTLTPAELFGLSDRLGSLEVGKDANLFVADGDPFETKTQIQHLFIQGYKVPLDSRQLRLYNEFLQRDPGLKR
jgi:imidazolonepropionase-like amidohydrolase